MLGHDDVSRYEYKRAGEQDKRHFLGTYQGHKFPLDPVDPGTIDIVDIAHALSHICRFNGHLPTFYSVAQHCMFVSDKLPGTPQEKLVALLHDAAEAYVCDVPAPVKPLLGQPYQDLFNNIQAAIYTKYGCQFCPAQLALYDKAACVYEAEAFHGYDGEDLKDLGYDVSVRCLWDPWEPKKFAGQMADREPGHVEADFLYRFEDLMRLTGRED